MDIKFMREALREAEKARQQDEVPVGAVLVCENKIVARAYNRKNTKKDAILHAEIIALQKAMSKLKDWHLNHCTLYVTLEPCPMCAGAIINARVGRVVFGASDPKAGCFGSLYDFAEDNKFNHRPQVYSGVLERECGAILTDYFKGKRKQKMQGGQSGY